MNESERADLDKQVRELWEQGLRKKRTIARRLAVDPKIVREVLERLGLAKKAAPVPNKLAPFHDRIRELRAAGLNNTRIRNEIKAKGYVGGKTILDDYIRKVAGPTKRAAKAFRRFETEPGVEAQADWTVHRVLIAGVERVVHFFAMVLAWSRYLFIGAFRDERLPTLLGAHVEAFEAFGGVASRIVYDNMTTVVIGRQRREIIWNPRLLEFARHWGYDPVACRPGDPNRKGKIEAPFKYHDEAFLKGREFESWDHLESEQRDWLALANGRVHGTTRHIPAERLEHERPLLTQAPDTPFPAYRREHRSVYHDSTVSIGGVRYSVPPALVKHTVEVRVHLRHIEVLDDRGTVRATHAIHDPRDGVVIDPAHYEGIRRGPAPTARGLESRFLSRFPGAEPFVAGLKLRMKSFAHVHTVQIERLALKYGTEATSEAIDRATRYRNFSAAAVARILADRHPLLAVDPGPTHVGTASAAANQALVDDTDTGSLADYDLDHIQEGDDDGAACCTSQ